MLRYYWYWVREWVRVWWLAAVLAALGLAAVVSIALTGQAWWALGLVSVAAALLGWEARTWHRRYWCCRPRLDDVLNKLDEADDYIDKVWRRAWHLGMRDIGGITIPNPEHVNRKRPLPCPE
jgi:hypothetical protein